MRNYVISGGAAHGPALWGALRRAIQKWPPKHLAGASIGAVIAACTAFGISEIEQYKAMHRLFSGNRITGGKNPFTFHPRVLWSRGGGFNDWSAVRVALTELFGSKKMGQAKIPLAIMVGDTVMGKAVAITSWLEPNVSVVEALCASTAIWPIADAQTIPSLGTGNRLFVDGGWGDNIPAAIFADAVEPTMVLCMEQSAPERSPRGAADLLRAVLTLAIYKDPDVPGRHDDQVVVIPSVGSGFDFNLSPDEIDSRIDIGKNCIDI